MNMNGILSLIENLSQIPGVSGDESLVADAVIEQIRDHCDYKVDALGNIIAYKSGKKRAKNKVLLSAHMDEIGFIITNIDDSGLLKFSTVGGIDSRVIPGKAVLIGHKQINGIIGAKALHQLKEKEADEPPKKDSLYIDIGAADKADALKHVNIGDRAVFASAFRRLGKNKIAGRAFDDRAGCAMLIELIRQDIEYDCVFAFTVQEETGCTGAATAGYRVGPDISIVVEATTASDIAGVEDDMVVCEQGKGAVVSFMDKGAVYDGELYKLTLKTASDNGLTCQSKAGVFGGNESRSIQTAKKGARVIGVSLPCRYIHSPSNMLHIDDIDSTFKLLRALIPVAASL